MNRKQALKTMTASSAILAFNSGFMFKPQPSKNMDATQLKGNINHAVCRWCYGKIPLDQLCEAAKGMGIKGIDLLGPDEWKVAIDHGLTCSLSTPGKFGIPDGFNDPSMHGPLYKNYADLIPKVADLGIKNIICFSGNRHGISDEAGMEICAAGLDKVVKLGEKYNVNVLMELLNSKLNHPDYQCDNSAWGVALCEKVGSERFKLLYDIYHMQIMEGDIIATIRKYHPFIGHYHTGGVPGRHEIDDTQELYYPAIMRAIVETGFTDYVAQEFIPAGDDPLASLRAAIQICDV